MKCIKIKYSKDDSYAELKRVRRERKRWFGNSARREIRAYQCEVCGCWHLTSMREEDHKSVKRKSILKKWLKRK